LSKLLQQLESYCYEIFWITVSYCFI